MEWISVHDRLPEIEAHVLVWDGGFAFGYLTFPEKIYSGKRPANAGQWRCEMYGYDGDDDWANNVTHWMPLPNPPKEE